MWHVLEMEKLFAEPESDSDTEAPEENRHLGEPSHVKSPEEIQEYQETKIPVNSKSNDYNVAKQTPEVRGVAGSLKA